MKKFLSNTIFNLYIVLFFLLPLVFTKNTSEYYELPKMFFMYIFGSLIVFLFVLKVILFENSLKNIKKPDFAIIAYLSVILLSTLFSSHIYTSLWGYYSRFNDGFVSILIFAGLYLVAVNSFDASKKTLLLDAGLLSVLPISLYAVFQIFSVDRVYSTFGQPNWLAGYLIFYIPLLIKKIQTNNHPYFWGLALLVAVVSLWFTFSLSGILALLFIVAYLAVNKKNFAYIGIFFILLAALNFNYLKSRVSDSITFNHADPGAYNISDSNVIRIGLWKSTLALSTANAKNFFVGIGPETFPYQFPFYRDPILNYSSEWDYILNKPHNYYLEILAESGVAALFAFLWILREFLKTKDRYLLAGFYGFAITLFFGWPTVYTAFLFWMWLAFTESS